MTLQLRRKLALFVCPEISAEQPAETVGARPTECAEPRTLTVAESVSPDNLLALANLICVHNGWKLSTLSRYAGNDGKFFKGLEDGKSCTLRTASKLLSWFSDNWPEELEWPSEISRPGVKAASEVFAANVLTSSDDVWRPALIADGRLHWIAPVTGTEGEDHLRKVSAAYVHANQTVPDAILRALSQAAPQSAAEETLHACRAPHATAPNGEQATHYSQAFPSARAGDH